MLHVLAPKILKDTIPHSNACATIVPLVFERISLFPNHGFCLP
jgi:hypothetical protein